LNVVKTGIIGYQTLLSTNRQPADELTADCSVEVGIDLMEPMGSVSFETIVNCVFQPVRSGKSGGGRASLRADQSKVNQYTGYPYDIDHKIL
jgi:hypothetical protein